MAAANDKELEWIKMIDDMERLPQQETTKEKFIRKFSENPLVPIGCLTTAAVLSFGLYSFKKGERQMSQYMMRARIGAQGLTVVALIVGVLYNIKKE